jgi:hypothetical protein
MSKWPDQCHVGRPEPAPGFDVHRHLSLIATLSLLGGFVSERDAAEPLERELERLRQERRVSRSLCEPHAILPARFPDGKRLRAPRFSVTAAAMVVS